MRSLDYVEKKITVAATKRYSPIEFQNACKEYFDTCDKGGKWTKAFVTKGSIHDVPVRTPYTLIGLASHLGMTMSSLYKLAMKPDYAEIIYMVFLKIKADLVEGSINGIYAHIPAARVIEVMNVAAMAIGMEESDSDEELLNLPDDKIAEILKKKAEIKKIQDQASNVDMIEEAKMGELVVKTDSQLGRLLEAEDNATPDTPIKMEEVHRGVKEIQGAKTEESLTFQEEVWKKHREYTGKAVQDRKRAKKTLSDESKTQSAKERRSARKRKK
jgi:hypothetical protein